MEHKSATTPDSSSNATPFPTDHDMEEVDREPREGGASIAGPSGHPTSLPLIVVPEGEAQSTVATPADPLMGNPDYMALKTFMDGENSPSHELNEERLIS